MFELVVATLTVEEEDVDAADRQVDSLPISSAAVFSAASLVFTDW